MTMIMNTVIVTMMNSTGDGTTRHMRAMKLTHVVGNVKLISELTPREQFYL